MKTSKKEKVEITTEDKYTKKQIINSKTFIDNRDLLNASLKEDKTYTINEVKGIIEKFKKGMVK